MELVLDSRPATLEREGVTMPDEAIAVLDFGSQYSQLIVRRLREIGVENEDDLREMGAVAAYRRLRFVFGREVSVIALHAMEAALRDCDWRRLPPEVKADLVRNLGPLKLGAMFVAHSLILKLFDLDAAGHRRLLHPLCASAPC